MLEFNSQWRSAAFVEGVGEWELCLRGWDSWPTEDAKDTHLLCHVRRTQPEGVSGGWALTRDDICWCLDLRLLRLQSCEP